MLHVHRSRSECERDSDGNRTAECLNGRRNAMKIESDRVSRGAVAETAIVQSHNMHRIAPAMHARIAWNKFTLAKASVLLIWSVSDANNAQLVMDLLYCVSTTTYKHTSRTVPSRRSKYFEGKTQKKKKTTDPAWMQLILVCRVYIECSGSYALSLASVRSSGVHAER